MARNAPAPSTLLDAVRGVRWPGRRPVARPQPGAHPSRLRGTSAEFSEYRPYRQGDDPRRIDWKLLARSDRAYVRLATDRALLPTTIVVDGSASMAFPEATLGKWRLAADVALGLAAVAQGQGDPTGIVVAAGDGASRVAPRARRDVLGEIARVLGAVKPGGSQPLAPRVRDAATPRLAIVTDLLGDADELLAAARLHVAAGGEVHLVHVVAREELELAASDRVVRDPERPAIERVADVEARREYAERFAAWRRDVADAWRASGASFTLVVDDEPAAHAVRRIVAGARA